VLGPLVEAADLEATWVALSAEQRRAVVALLVDVKILATTSGRVFRREHVQITWR